MVMVPFAAPSPAVRRPLPSLFVVDLGGAYALHLLVREDGPRLAVVVRGREPIVRVPIATA